MPANDRAPSYQWFPRDFAAKMRLLMIDDPTELAYRRALDASWDSGSYGVGTLDEWIRWSGAEPDCHPSFKQLLAKETQAQADGSLVQFAMVMHRHQQVCRYMSAASRGSRGGRISHGGMGLKPASSTRKPNLPYASASAVAVEPTDSLLATLVGSPSAGLTNPDVGNGHHPDPVVDWESGFDEFWGMYPRRVSRVAALRSWRKIRPKGADQAGRDLAFGQILDRLEHWVRWWQERGTEAEFIPHAATWLNQRRYEQEPA